MYTSNYRPQCKSWNDFFFVDMCLNLFVLCLPIIEFRYNILGKSGIIRILYRNHSSIRIQALVCINTVCLGLPILSVNSVSYCNKSITICSRLKINCTVKWVYNLFAVLEVNIYILGSFAIIIIVLIAFYQSNSIFCLFNL